MQEISTYLAPRRLDEALQAMADGDATVLCGGTDLAPQTESGVRQYTAKLLNIRRIEGLGGIEAQGAQVRIGAATTISEIRRNPALAEVAPVHYGGAGARPVARQHSPAASSPKPERGHPHLPHAHDPRSDH